MPDNFQQTTVNQENVRINIHQKNDVSFWSGRFGVSTINLKIAVSETGGKAKDVEVWLKKNKFMN